MKIIRKSFIEIGSFSVVAHYVHFSLLLQYGTKRPLDLSMSQRSPRVTGFKMADEIPYAESNGAEIVAIGQVDLNV